MRNVRGNKIQIGGEKKKNESESEFNVSKEEQNKKKMNLFLLLLLLLRCAFCFIRLETKIRRFINISTFFLLNALSVITVRKREGREQQ